jgi:GntR family transcriptional repressor for pyruvate dehydrogenase complex
VGSLARLKRPVKNRRRAAPAITPPVERASLHALESIKRTRLPEEIANQLRKLIVDGTFKPKQPLPSERALAEHLGVSRSSVRDGIRRLEVVGLLETRHGQGTFLQELSVDHVVTPLASVLTFHRARHDDLMDVRRMFEPAVARAAASRATEEEFDEIERILTEQRRKARAGEATLIEDAAFHAALARATHNPVVVRMMEILNDLLVESDTRTLQSRGRQFRSLRGHHAVIEALRRRDADGAALAMRDHIDQIDALLKAGRPSAGSRG